MAMGEEKTMGRKVQRTLGESVTTKIKPTSVRKTGLFSKMHAMSLKLKKAASVASVATFEMNNFVQTLEFEYECWRKNTALPYNSMTTAEYRSNQLRTDAHVIEAIQNGTLPASSCAEFPAVTECAKEELTCSDWL